jgi:hypothetical protein
MPFGVAIMEIPVQIEPIPGVGLRASSSEPFAIVVQAATREGALDQFRGQIAAKLPNGACVETVEIQKEQSLTRPIRSFKNGFE